MAMRPSFLPILSGLLAASFAAASETWVEPGDSTGASLGRIVHIPVPEVPRDRPNTAALRERFREGQERRGFGKILAWGGLGAGVAGVAFDRPDLTTLGILGYSVGIPVMGSGTSQMVRNRNSLGTQPRLETDGWIPFWVGYSLEGSGIMTIAFAIPLAILHKYEPAPEIDAMFRWGRNAFVAGLAVQGLAWVRFDRSAARAEEADRKVPFELSLLPAGQGPDGALRPGATVTLRF